MYTVNIQALPYLITTYSYLILNNNIVGVK